MAKKLKTEHSMFDELERGRSALPLRAPFPEPAEGGLRQVIQLLPREFEIVGALEDGAGLRDAARNYQPDIIVLDIALPPVNGIALASQLRKAGCSTKIVFLTVHSDPDYVRAAFAAGAFGYVVKTRLSLDIVPALRAALRGEQFISPTPELEGME